MRPPSMPSSGAVFLTMLTPASRTQTHDQGPGGEATPEPIPEHRAGRETAALLSYADNTGLRYAEKIDREELPKMDGAAVVSVSVSGFHSSQEGTSTRSGMRRLPTGTARDTQTTPMAQVHSAARLGIAASDFCSLSKYPPRCRQSSSLTVATSDGSGGTSGNNRILLPRQRARWR